MEANAGDRDKIAEKMDLPPENFNPELDLIDEMGIDSMDLATIALVIRDDFDIEIDEDDYAELTTLGRIVEYVKVRLAA